MAQRETTTITDEQLAGALRDGEEHAFTELMRRYQNKVFAMAYRYLKNHDDAADVAQEVFVRIYRHIGMFTGASRLSTWIYRVTANASLSALRKRSTRKESMFESLDQPYENASGSLMDEVRNPRPDPRETLQDKQFEKALMDKLQQLPESYRMTFLLREMGGLTYEEIADVTSVPMGTVRSRLHQARHRLREMLAPYMSDKPERPSAPVEESDSRARR